MGFLSFQFKPFLSLKDLLPSVTNSRFLCLSRKCFLNGPDRNFITFTFCYIMVKIINVIHNHYFQNGLLPPQTGEERILKY